MSREEIIAAIRTCARKLKRVPKREELSQAGVSLPRVSRLFGCFSQALREAGLKGKGSGYLIPTRELLLDWAKCARKLGRLPFLSEYTKMGRSSHGPFLRRFGTWGAVPAAFARLAQDAAIGKEWKDVLEMVRRRSQVELRKNSLSPYARQWGDANEPARGEDNRRRESLPSKFRKGRALAGPPLNLNGLAHEPANEMGVVFFFGMLAERLGFRVLSFHTRFPDCEAMREVGPGHWQRVGIEFEYESRNYRIHGHRNDGCDLIVCWRHNWPKCPKSLEVMELRGMVGRL